MFYESSQISRGNPGRIVPAMPSCQLLLYATGPVPLHPLYF